MYFAISFLAAMVGLALAAAAAILPDTGVDGTPGAFLAVLGAAGVLSCVGLLATRRFSGGARRVLIGVAGLTAFLTAMAAWFLMQNEVLVAFAISLLALVAGSAIVDRKTIR
jgi:ABC-type enterobactin transport system permease subunit